MSAALEARYRAALRWYPRSWRAENADAIVGTMLDQAEAEGRSAPRPAELRNLASSGIGRRFESFAPQVVRDRVAAVALAIGTAYALIMLVGAEWAPFATSGPFNQWMPSVEFDSYTPSTNGFGPFASALVIVYAMWLVAFTLVLLRLSRTAIALLLLTIPVLVWIRTVRMDDIGALQPTTFMMILTALIGILACVGQPARVGRRVIAILLGAVMTLALAVLMRSPLHEGRLSTAGAAAAIFDAPGYAIILVLAGVMLAIGRKRAWAVASLVSAAPWLSIAPMWILFDLTTASLVGAALASLAFGAGVTVWMRLRSRVSEPSSLVS